LTLDIEEETDIEKINRIRSFGGGLDLEKTWRIKSAPPDSRLIYKWDSLQA
jgi:hypothetical protein